MSGIQSSSKEMLICGLSDLNFEIVQEKGGGGVNPFPDTPFANYQLKLLFLVPLLWAILVRGGILGLLLWDSGTVLRAMARTRCPVI